MSGIDYSIDTCGNCSTEFTNFWISTVPSFFTETIPEAFHTAWNNTAEWIDEFVKPFFESCQIWFEENADWLWPVAITIVAGTAVILGVVLTCIACKKSDEAPIRKDLPKRHLNKEADDQTISTETESAKSGLSNHSNISIVSLERRPSSPNKDSAFLEQVATLSSRNKSADSFQEEIEETTPRQHSPNFVPPRTTVVSLRTIPLETSEDELYTLLAQIPTSPPKGATHEFDEEFKDSRKLSPDGSPDELDLQNFSDDELSLTGRVTPFETSQLEKRELAREFLTPSPQLSLATTTSYQEEEDALRGALDLSDNEQEDPVDEPYHQSPSPTSSHSSFKGENPLPKAERRREILEQIAIHQEELQAKEVLLEDELRRKSEIESYIQEAAETLSTKKSEFELRLEKLRASQLSCIDQKMQIFRSRQNLKLEDLCALDNELNSWSTELTELTSNKQGKNQRAKNLKGWIEERLPIVREKYNSEEFKIIEDRAGEIGAEIAAIRSTIDTLEDNFQSLKTHWEGILNDEIDGEIEILESQIGSLKEEITSLKEKLGQ